MLLPGTDFLAFFLGSCLLNQSLSRVFVWGVTLESLQKPHSNSKATLAVDYGGLRVNVPVTDSGHGRPPCRKDTSLSPAPAVPLALASAQLHEFMSDVSPSRPASLAPLAFSLFPSTPAPLHWQTLMHAAPSP